MNRKHRIGISLAILIALILIFNPFSQKEPAKNGPSDSQASVEGYKNAVYTIEGKPVTLTNGFSEVESVPGSASRTLTRYFGNELRHDLNNDGREDIAFLLTQETGGSGAFFYAVAALNMPTGYIGSHAFLLGDRIAPQSTNIDEGATAQGTNRDNVIVINFATRKQGEPMTAEPTVGKSVWIKLDPATMQFGEVEMDFEGESR